MGRAELTIGPMNSGKTAYLIVQYNNLKLNNLKVLTMKPSLDTRDYGMIASRILPNYRIQVDKVLSPNDQVPINEILSENYDVILVDEIQMFTEHQVRQLHYLTVISDVHVYMYGLLMSCTGDPFKASMLAKALCDDVVELHTINKQKQRKEYAVKYDENNMPVDISKTEQIEAGDSIYKAVSKQEYFTIYGEYMKNYMGVSELPTVKDTEEEDVERVLAVEFSQTTCTESRRKVLKEILTSEYFIDNLLNVKFCKRDSAERDNTLVQLLKMTAIGRYTEDGKLELFTVERINKSTETRLHNLKTCLFGGHVNPSDKLTTLTDTLECSRLRELSEELVVDTTNLIDFKELSELIYTPSATDSENVSNFHAGLATLLIVDSSSPIFVKESHKLTNGRFIPVEQLLDETVETWSRVFAEIIMSEEV